MELSKLYKNPKAEFDSNAYKEFKYIYPKFLNKENPFPNFKFKAIIDCKYSVPVV